VEESKDVFQEGVDSHKNATSDEGSRKRRKYLFRPAVIPFTSH